MTPLLQYVVTGLTTGSTYALVGLGIALIVQVTGVVNFAQGEFVMLGGLTFALLEEKHVPAPLAALAAVAGTVLVGVLLERLVLPRQRAGRTDQTIMLTIGASIVIEGIALVFVGTEPHFATRFSDATLHPFGITLAVQYLWIIAVTAVVMVGLWLWLTRTRTGWAMRATAMDPDAARLSGISPARMSLAVFALAAALGGIGGVVLAPLQAPDASIGISVGLKGFTAAVIGGLDWPVGAVVGGLVLGVAESVAAGYLPAGWGDAVAYVLLVLVLLARPTGLIRAVAAVRV
jgi:branched-chain amino acid transport system permease protein